MSPSCAPLPTVPTNSSAEARSDPFLLEAHCSQSPVLVDVPARDGNAGKTPSLSFISALELAQLINDPGEIINASFPRLSALLTDAEAFMAAKRIDELSVQLEQVSKLLQELITDLLPNAATEQESGTLATSQAIPEPEITLADVPAESTPATDISTQFEHRRVMAMAA